MTDKIQDRLLSRYGRNEARHIDELAAVVATVAEAMTFEQLR
jgi:hypothetical protein